MQDALTDVQIFISSFVGATESVAHIYLSALSWAPENSWICRELAPLFKHDGLIDAGKQDEWTAQVWARNFNTTVWCLAYSPNGRHIACGLRNGIIYICDAHTGTTVLELQDHSGCVESLAYSPDSRMLVSG